MALIICKDCKKEFSSDVWRCPHCGAHKPLSNKGPIAFGALLLFFFVLIYNHHKELVVSNTNTITDSSRIIYPRDAYVQCIRKELRDFQMDQLNMIKRNMSPQELKRNNPSMVEILNLFPTNDEFVSYFNSRCQDEANDYIFNKCIPSGQTLSQCLMGISSTPNIIWNNRSWIK